MLLPYLQAQYWIKGTLLLASFVQPYIDLPSPSISFNSPPETRLCHSGHGASQQGDRYAEEAVRGHLSGAEGGPARGRGGKVSTRLGLSGEGQDSGREGEHTVRSGLKRLFVMWKYVCFLLHVNEERQK